MRDHTSVAMRWEEVTVQLGGAIVVEDVSFEAPAGSVTGLLGPNGAGKTTCFRALIGHVRPVSGRARVVGGGAVGAVAEPVGLDPELSATRNLLVAARLLGLHSPRAAARAALDDVGVGDCAGQRVRTLSTGQRQRVAIARAMLGRPSCLVLDEPFNGLDPAGIAWLRALVHELAEGGRAVLLSSHLLGEIDQIVDRVVVLDRTVRFEGTTGEFDRAGVGVERRFFDLVGTSS